MVVLQFLSVCILLQALAMTISFTHLGRLKIFRNRQVSVGIVGSVLVSAFSFIAFSLFPV